MAAKVIKDLHSYSCAMCLDIFEVPILLPCSHTFCNSCVKSFVKVECPLCRSSFQWSQAKPNLEMRNLLKQLVTECEGCKAVILLDDYRTHIYSCNFVKIKEQKTLLAHKVSPNESVSKENRFTFVCPYCHTANLDHLHLIEHCNRLHRSEISDVVCPICSSMPWGDSDFKSSNFINHLNVRHKFEYDTFVDYDMSDDAMLDLALKESLKQ